MKRLLSLPIFTVLLLLTSLNSAAVDGFIYKITVNKYLKTNTDYELKAYISNGTTPYMLRYQVNWQLDNGPINMGQVVQLYPPGLGTSPGLAMPHVHGTPLNVSNEGMHVLKIWVEADDDPNHSNDTVTIVFHALSEYADKTVLFEEYTATWCQYCPPANQSAQNIADLPYAVVAKFHNSDGFSFAEGEDYIESYYTSQAFTPGGVLEMGELGTYAINSSHNGWQNQVEAKAGSISPAAFTLTKDIDTLTREITIKADVDFKYSEPGDYYINAYILENGIAGPQANASSGYRHNNVVRHLLGGVSGTGDVVPANPVVHANYSHTYTYTIPSGWNIDSLDIIGMLFIKQNNKTTSVNAARADTATITEPPVPDSVEEQEEDALKAYPNPFGDYFTIELPQVADKVIVTVYSIHGKIVHSETFDKTSSYQLLNINLSGRNLTPGFYTLRLQADNYTYAKRLVKF